MLSWLKSSRERRQVARSLYGSSVTAARAVTFYADWGVPDTLAGRFEMIALHVALLLHRLSAVSAPERRLRVALTEAFVVDMDDSMRELTFGDLAVPREIKRATAALFDRHAAYLAALAGSSDISLSDALKVQLAYLGGAPLNSGRLADYVQRCTRALDAQPTGQILAGRVEWPDPAAT
jgi:cytochrome b pre-mRNA-processing protein 3